MHLRLIFARAVQAAVLAFGLLTGSAAMAAEYELSGTVTVSGGGALAGTVVNVLEQGTSTVVATDTADAGGAYSIVVEEGAYDLRAVPPSGSGYAPVLYPNYELDTNSSFNFIVFLQSGDGTRQISGTVYDANGVPAPNQYVNFSGAGWSAAESTDSFGVYSLVVHTGSASLQLAGDSNPSGMAAPRGYVLNASLDIADDMVLDLTIPASKVTVHVRGPGGVPVQGATMTLSAGFSDGCFMSLAGDDGACGYSLGLQGTTDASGDADIWSFIPTSGGTGSLDVTPPTGSDYVNPAPQSIPVEIDGEVTVNLTELPEEHDIEGIITDGLGGPAAGVFVQFSGSGWNASDITNEFGIYSVTAREGMAEVQLAGADFVDVPLPHDFIVHGNYEVTADATLDMAVPVSKVTVHVRGPGGVPVQGATMTLSAGFSDGCFMFLAGDVAACGYTSGLRGVTDASGDADIWSFIPTAGGTGSLDVTPPTGSDYVNPAPQSIPVEIDGEVTVNLTELPEQYTVSGTVFDAEGVPAANQYLNFSGSGWSVAQSTDSSGHYSVVVNEGSASLQLAGDSNPSGMAAPRGYVLNASLDIADDMVLDLTIPASKVTVHVRGPGGVPVQGATMTLSAGFSDGCFMSLAGDDGACGYSLGLQGTTDASGDADIWSFIPTSGGTGTLSVSAPSGSSFLNPAPQVIAVTPSGEYLVSLQYNHALPTVEAIFSQVPNGNGDYVSPVSITLTAVADQGHEIQNIYYILDAGSTQEYEGPISGLSVGEHMLEFWAVDDADVEGAHETATFTVVGAGGGPLILVTPLPDARMNVAYSSTLEISDGEEPYTWSISAGNLPPGMSLNSSTGVISGTSPVPGDFTFTVSVTDSSEEPMSASMAYSLKVKGFIITTTLAGGAVGEAYSITLGSTGGTAPFQWSVVGGSLPTGLSLGASNGVISGTPAAAGTARFIVKLQDAEGATSFASYKIMVE